MVWIDIIKQSGGGTCYPDAYNWMMDNFGGFSSDTSNRREGAKLAHATVTGTGGGIEGVEYGHAFILINDNYVIDVATGKEVGFPKDVYYKVGNVKDVKLYTFNEMIQAALTSGHYGPWH
tara:strand:- start:930 stop:1289 length:360 start_codon:yes stop_codon:yes gene_type:complete